MNYRIGVDVGGTFTDAVALNNETLDLVGIVKVLTTHHHSNGVAEGIRLALLQLLQEHGISPEAVVFIAHGTTQSTNALLEGDVEPVAVIGSGDGWQALSAKRETALQALQLDGGKEIPVCHFFIKDYTDEKCRDVIRQMKDRGIHSAVAAAAYSVDCPEREDRIGELLQTHGVLCTRTHDMSGLYGLRTRTKTAVINASIMKKMIDTTRFMIESVARAGIQKPLMIMRSDGGIMSAEEVKKRPVQTILSGPAAGVAGALLYGHVKEGIFLETGGTSTDISAIHNGEVMLRWAHIGSHKTYVHSLDIHTLAIGGGSMLRQEEGRLRCGPRSAHIAGLEYVCYAKDLRREDLQVVSRRYGSDAAEYYTIKETGSGREYALTLTCIANYAGYIADDEFSAGSKEAVRMALELLADYLHQDITEMTEEVFRFITDKIGAIVRDLLGEYHMVNEGARLIGGGGGCCAVVPAVAERLAMPYQICPASEVISPIGVAIAMVHEIVEKHMTAPTQQELIRLKEEVIQKALQAGAIRENLEIRIEQEPHKGIVRATATGVTDQGIRTRVTDPISFEECKKLLQAKGYPVEDSHTKYDGNGKYWIFQMEEKETHWLKRLFFHKKTVVALISAEGEWKLLKKGGIYRKSAAGAIGRELVACLDDYSSYGDAGERIPDVYLVAGNRLIDYSMLRERGQILQMAEFEVQQFADIGELFIICVPVSCGEL